MLHSLGCRMILDTHNNSRIRLHLHSTYHIIIILKWLKSDIFNNIPSRSGCVEINKRRSEIIGRVVCCCTCQLLSSGNITVHTLMSKILIIIIPIIKKKNERIRCSSIEIIRGWNWSHNSKRSVCQNVLGGNKWSQPKSGDVFCNIINKIIIWNY